MFGDGVYEVVPVINGQLVDEVLLAEADALSGGA